MKTGSQVKILPARRPSHCAGVDPSCLDPREIPSRLSEATGSPSSPIETLPFAPGDLLAGFESNISVNDLAFRIAPHGSWPMDSKVAKPTGEPGTILVVEDEPELLAPLEYSLSRAGFATVTAPDGLTACRLVGQRRPDLILLDIMLPDLDGWEVCKLIRRHPDETMATVPLIMLTALGSADDRLKGLALGADAYLPKPYSIREVIAQARNLLARRKKQLALHAQLDQYRHHESLQTDIQSIVFHELRNQLLIIGGFSELLRKGAVHPEEGNSRDYLQAIHRSSTYLSFLAEEFLLVRKVEDGGLTLPPQLVNPGEVLAQLVELFEPTARDKQVTLRFAKSPNGELFVLNQAALKVILSNLLENAIRYGGAGARVTLGWGKTQNGGLTLEVADTGPGITAEDQAHIFERFYRGAPHGTGVGGSGLGLYIVKTLVEALHGKVSVHSAPGSGTRFCIEFEAHGEEPSPKEIPTLP